MSWTEMRQRFRIEDNKVIYTNQKDNEDQIEIYSKRKYNEIINWTYKILALENNRSLLYRLVEAMPKKRGIVSKLSI